MDNQTLLRTGIVGSIGAAICCATPILVILLGAVGLSAWAVGLDYVFIPTLIVFVGLTVYALNQRKHAVQCSAPGTAPNTGHGEKNEHA